MNVSKKYIMVIICVFIIVIIGLLIYKSSIKVNNTLKNEISERNDKDNLQTNYDDVTGLYRIVNSETGKQLVETYDKDELKRALEFYSVYPDYYTEIPSSSEDSFINDLIE